MKLAKYYILIRVKEAKSLMAYNSAIWSFIVYKYFSLFRYAFQDKLIARSKNNTEPIKRLIKQLNNAQ